MKTTVKTTKKATTTKIAKVDVKGIVPVLRDKSKGQIAIETRIQALEAKQLGEGLNRSELVYLANAYEKLECKSITRVYREIQLKFKAKDSTILAIIGKATFPDFKQWAELMPMKHQYSYFDGVRTLSKFNKIATTKGKVERQNKAVASI